MTILEAILLAVIQGIFMFFPVSSTSHLVLVQHWLIGRGSEIPSPESPAMILFDLIVHVGTLVSIAVVFRVSLGRYLSRVWSDAQRVLHRQKGVFEPLHLRLTMLGLLSFFVTGVVGLTAKPLFEKGFAHPLAISGTLAITGALLYFTDTVGRRPRGLREITVLMAVVIGLAQAMALVPGFSRSGLTIAIALYLGLKRRWAAEYSFFLAFPTILAATAVQTLQLDADDLSAVVGMIGPLVVAFIVSAAVGIVALQLVLVLLYRARFRYFAYYVWVLAVVVAIASLTGRIGPDFFKDGEPPVADVEFAD